MPDIVERLERVVRRHILSSMPPASDGSLAQMSFSELLIEYRTWRGRFIPPQPRRVQISRELQASSGAQNYRVALDALRRKLEAGEDLTPYLSTRIHDPFANVRAPNLEHRTDRDAMLAEWGVHHLHLSTNVRRRVARRGDDVLFAAFTADIAYLIDIRAHPKHANWAAEDLFAIIVRNWPDAGLVHPINALGLAQKFSDDDRLQLRNAGVSSLLEIDGRVYAPGPLGQTAAGTPMQVTREVQALRWALRSWREDFEGTLLANRPDAPPNAYWVPAVDAPHPGFEEYCGFETTTTRGRIFAPAGRLC